MRSVLGAPPAMLSASAQYSGSLVNWSQATQAPSGHVRTLARQEYVRRGEHAAERPPAAITDQPSNSPEYLSAAPR